MKYIIMCGGKYSAWRSPKHLAEVCGEPLVKRTIRLLKEADVDDIAISSNDRRFDGLGVPRLEHDNEYKLGRNYVNGIWVRGFYPTDEPACYLMGDVVFSPDAIRTIVTTQTDNVRFFASVPPFSPLYTKPWGEPFAFKVENQQKFRWAIKYIEAHINTGIFRRHPVSWELWQVIIGADVNDINYETITSINDYTCDIDELADIPKIERMIYAKES